MNNPSVSIKTFLNLVGSSFRKLHLGPPVRKLLKEGLWKKRRQMLESILPAETWVHKSGTSSQVDT